MSFPNQPNAENVAAPKEQLDPGNLGEIPEGLSRREWEREQFGRIALFGMQGVMQQNQAAQTVALAGLGVVQPGTDSAEEKGDDMPLTPNQIADLARVSPIGSTVNYVEQHFDIPSSGTDSAQNPSTAPERQPQPVAEPPTSQGASRGTTAAIGTAALLAGILGAQLFAGGNDTTAPPSSPPTINGVLEWESPTETTTSEAERTRDSTIVGEEESSG